MRTLHDYIRAKRNDLNSSCDRLSMIPLEKNILNETINSEEKTRNDNIIKERISEERERRIKNKEKKERNIQLINELNNFVSTNDQKSIKQLKKIVKNRMSEEMQYSNNLNAYNNRILELKRYAITEAKKIEKVKSVQKFGRMERSRTVKGY